MTDNTAAAIAAFARDASVLLARLAEQLDPAGNGQSVTGRTTMSLPLRERILRQSLILKEIQQAGGAVSQEQWRSIASRYGYEGRGLAGFFRSNNQGLLGQRANGAVVYITRHGRERLAQNKDRVEAFLNDEGLTPLASSR